MTLHDVVEISALQFQTVSITVDIDVIKTKQLKIQLIEQVNHLDAVTLSSGLSGNLITDISNVKTVDPIRIDMGNMNTAFEYNDEKAFDNKVVDHHLKSIINPEDRNYLPDAVKIFKLFFKPKKRLSVEKKVEEKPKDLLDVYNQMYISKTFNIPEEHVEAFVAFVEDKGIDSRFLERKNEMQLIEFLIKKRELFLKLRDVKN